MYGSPQVWVQVQHKILQVTIHCPAHQDIGLGLHGSLKSIVGSLGLGELWDWLWKGLHRNGPLGLAAPSFLGKEVKNAVYVDSVVRISVSGIVWVELDLLSGWADRI